MILIDSGVIVAAAVSRDTFHHSCSELLAGARLANRRLLLPATVTAEVGYLIQHYAGAAAEASFLAGVADGDFETEDLVPADYARMSELVEQYDDFPLGTTDASVIALAERLGVNEIGTTDRRHFTSIRPSHVEHFTLLPETLG
jgi:predicted nucleic acid-binding protein